MTTAIDHHRRAVEALCRQFDVHRLELFGSATGPGFDAKRSDFDFIVDFGAGEQVDLFNRYFGLKQALEQTLGRDVDLVMAGALANPHVIDAVNRTRQPVYARTLTEVA